MLSRFKITLFVECLNKAIEVPGGPARLAGTVIIIRDVWPI